MKNVDFRRIKNLGLTTAYVFAVIISIFQPQLAAADALIDYSGGTVAGEVEDTIALPGITVSGSDPTIPLTLSINDGILRMTDTTGITFDGSSTGSTISFSGSVSDMNNALATLEYRTLVASTKTLTATILAEGSVYFPDNGHMYEVVDNGSGIDWYTAIGLASMRTFNGATGYLATVTTQAENDYLVGRLSGDGWFGASDESAEGDWRWINGPETGTAFWTGLGDGAAVDGLFSNWAGSEPNDAGDGEDCAQFYSDGSGWNDLPCDYSSLQYYVVEYGAPGDLPTAPESISFDVEVSTPTPADILIDSCLDLIDVYNNGTDNRYDNLSLTTDVDCTGETLTPMFSQSDVDFGVIGFRGNFNGNNHTLSGVSLNYPGDNGIGLFSATNNATFSDLTISGSTNGNQCVGGLVGIATNTDFTNVTTSVAVNAYEYVGGLVGCNLVDNSTGSSFTNNTSSGEIFASYGNVGGLIGEQTSHTEGALTISNNTVTAVIEADSWAAGGIVGYMSIGDETTATIEDNSVPAIDNPNASTIGGIVGYAQVEEASELLIQSNDILGQIAGVETVGGIVGSAYNYTDFDESFKIFNQVVNQNVSSNDSDDVGGIIGYAEDVWLENVSVNASIYSEDDEAGGLIGESNNSTIIESTSSGSVESSDSFAGGLVGRNSETTIRRSYSTADVTGDDRVGGLVGANGGYIYDSYARGTVTAYSNEAGGLAGRCGREIYRSYATGEVTAPTSAGGLIGSSDGCDVVDSFWDTETSMQSTSDGDETGKTTAEMKLLANFTDTATLGLSTTWDFATVWALYEDINDGYPCLQWTDDCQETPETDDTDGIAASVEDNAPNAGDANNDGTVDSIQNNVSSFVNPVTNKYTVVQTDAACSLAAVSAAAETAKSVADSGYNYPTGLVNFTANCGTPGYTTTVRVIVFDVSPSGLTLRKFNPNTSAYFSVSGATLSSVTIGGRSATVATYQIVDGGVLDTDGVVNGTIVDPVGLASQAVGVPNTGFSR